MLKNCLNKARFQRSLPKYPLALASNLLAPRSARA